MGEIRGRLGLKATEQNQLDRRKRDLKIWIEMRRVREGSTFRYFFVRERDAPLGVRGLSQKSRAEVLHRSHGRCSMCGRTIERDGIVLAVDHKVPRDWGGTDDLDNLWALCQDCNGGKKNYFGSQDQSLMRRIMGKKSIHERVGETLKSFKGMPVPNYLIEFVAGQDEWRKRLRELRYMGWKIKATRKKEASGKVRSFYTLNHFEPWPDDPSRWVQNYEKTRALRRKSERSQKH